jgi:hypothetical protein
MYLRQLEYCYTINYNYLLLTCFTIYVIVLLYIAHNYPCLIKHRQIKYV